MNITLVVDRLNWGGHHQIINIVKVCNKEHEFTVTDLLGLNEDSVKSADLVVGWIDSTEEAIYRLWKKYKFAFSSRIAGWRGIYRTTRYPTYIKDAIVGVVCCSEELAITTRRVYPIDLIVTIPVGVDTSDFIPIHKLGSGWGWVGRETDSQKDVDMRNQIMRKYKHVKKLGQKRWGKKVAPTNWPDSMVEFYQGCRGFFRTSRLEGSSNSLLEAMSCGLPVLATPTGVAFRIIPPECLMMDPQHFVESIKELDKDISKAEEIGNRNRQTVLDGWTIQDRKEPWLEFFDRCMDGGK